jgi:hypothetical protein
LESKIDDVTDRDTFKSSSAYSTDNQFVVQEKYRRESLEHPVTREVDRKYSDEGKLRLDDVTGRDTYKSSSTHSTDNQFVVQEKYKRESLVNPTMNDSPRIVKSRSESEKKSSSPSASKRNSVMDDYQSSFINKEELRTNSRKERESKSDDENANNSRYVDRTGNRGYTEKAILGALGLLLFDSSFAIIAVNLFDSFFNE